MSNLATLARPYAKAAFELAQDRDALADWDRLLNVAGQVVSEAPMSALLGNPLARASQAVAIITEALGDEADSTFVNFIGVLGDNDRLSLLPEIAVLFRGFREEAEKRLSVRVVSAIALEQDQAERMKAALAKRFDREIEMVSEIDASVLGGAVIYAGDQVIDGSLLGRLQRLQANLSN
jgi:F-type H+-transporting ATPase subunit delta